MEPTEIALKAEEFREKLAIHCPPMPEWFSVQISLPKPAHPDGHKGPCFAKNQKAALEQMNGHITVPGFEVCKTWYVQVQKWVGIYEVARVSAWPWFYADQVMGSQQKADELQAKKLIEVPEVGVKLDKPIREE